LEANSAYHPWDGKDRYGSFHWRINAGCAGKAGRSLENVCHTWVP